MFPQFCRIRNKDFKVLSSLAELLYWWVKIVRCKRYVYKFILYLSDWSLFIKKSPCWSSYTWYYWIYKQYDKKGFEFNHLWLLNANVLIIQNFNNNISKLWCSSLPRNFAICIFYFLPDNGKNTYLVNPYCISLCSFNFPSITVISNHLLAEQIHVD